MQCCHEQLAGGAFGHVHCAVHKQRKTAVAVKAIVAADTKWARLTREVFSGFNVHHPCLVSFHEIFLWNEQVHIVMDLIESCKPELTRCSDLLSYLLIINNNTPLTDHETALVVYQVASALKYLAERLGSIHRDLKPENILVGPAGLTEIKLADYGGIRLCYEESSIKRELTRNVGSPSYMAHEVSTPAYDNSADVYSLGCVAYVCGTIKTYQSSSSVHLRNWSPEACLLLEMMLKYFAQQRISASELVDHEWLLGHVMQHEDLVTRLQLKPP